MNTLILNRTASNCKTHPNTINAFAKSFLEQIILELGSKDKVTLDGFGTFKIKKTKAHRLSFDVKRAKELGMPLDSVKIVPAKVTVIFTADEGVNQFVDGKTADFKI